MYQGENYIGQTASNVNQNPTIISAIRYFFAPGEVFELCVLGPRVRKARLWDDEYISSGAGKKGLAAGWFDDPAKAASIAAQADSQASPEGIYLTLNPVNPALLGRANNRLRAGAARTNDSEITTLRQLYIDADPTRPAGVSSSEAEKAAAIDLLNHIQTHMTNFGWPEPLFAESGNGGHLIYRLPDLTNTQKNIDLIKACLQALAAQYDTDQIKIDQKVFNPARISKLYGTHARKGDSTPDRPHRLAQIISAPSEPIPVQMDMLHALAALAPAPEPKPSPRPTNTSFRGDSQPLDMPAYLAKYGRTLLKTKQHGTSTLFILDECVFNPDHKGGEAAIGQTADGKLFYQCYHNSCNGRTWHEARQLISGDEPLFERGKEKSNKVVGLQKDRVTTQQTELSDTFPEVAALNQKHAVTMSGGKCVVINEVFDPVFQRPDITLSAFQDFKNYYSNQKVQIETPDGLKDVSIGKIWTSWHGRRQYEGIVFDPTNKTDASYYNLWRGLAYEPRQGDWSLLQAHLLNVVCCGDEDHYNWLIAWLADTLQNPGNKPGTSVVLKGQKGTGKSFWVVMFGELVGNHFLHIFSQRQLTGKFNNHLKDALIVFVDEGFWAGDKSSEGTLKGLITEKYNLIEPKGKDSFPVKNHIHVIMSSNEEWVVPAGLEERRFFVLEVDNEHTQDTQYFKYIVDQMDNGGREAMLYDLLHYDYSQIDLRTAPKTQGLFNQITRTLEPHQKYWFEHIEDGLLLGSKWPEIVKTQELYTDYILFCEHIGTKYPLSPGEFKKQIKMLCPNLKEIRPRTNAIEGNNRPRCTIIPPLVQCRAAFCQSVRMELQWDEPEESVDDRSSRSTHRSEVVHD